MSNSIIPNTNSPLPEGWRWVRLGECKINPPRPRGFSRASDAQTTFVPMAAVDEKTGTIARPEVVPYSKVSQGYTYFEENDVLFAKITPCMQNGKHVIAKNLIDGLGFGTTEFHVIRPNNEVLPDWIHFFIRQPYFLQEATAYFTGAVGQQRVPDEFLSNYTIPLPPIEEQRHLVAKIQELMQEVESARTASEKQLEAAKALPSSYLHEVFESEEAKKWGRRRLGEVCDGDSGVWGDVPDSSKDCYPILRSNNIQDGAMVLGDVAIRKVIEPSIVEAKSLKTGDILVTTSSGSKDLLGKSALFFQPSDGKTYLFSNFTMRVSAKNGIIDSIFLYFYLQSPEAKETLKLLQDTTTGLRNMDKKEFLNQMIPIPPISTQRRIASYLKEKMAYVEKLRKSIEKQLEAINALPQAILRKAFRGEL